MRGTICKFAPKHSLCNDSHRDTHPTLETTLENLDDSALTYTYLLHIISPCQIQHSATEPYEWYQSYHGIRHLLTPFHLSASQGMNPAKPRRILEALVPRLATSQEHFPSRNSCRILVLGCGNSRLPEDMIRDGWTGGIVCVDWSNIVIQQMEAKYSPQYLDRLNPTSEVFRTRQVGKAPATRNNQEPPHPHPLLEFQCADVIQGLDYDDATFDLIICKGSFDAMITNAAANARLLNQECHRLLKGTHGVMVVITHGNPESRLVFFENPEDEWWSDVGIHTILKAPKDRRHLMENKDGSR